MTDRKDWPRDAFGGAAMADTRTKREKLVEQAKALISINATGNGFPRVPNLAVDIIQGFIDLDAPPKQPVSGPAAVADWAKATLQAVDAAHPSAAPTGNTALVEAPVAIFGHGKLAVDTGTHYGTPAVFVGPVPEAGEVGKKVKTEHKLPKDRLIEGEFFMTFPTEEQAKRVADALVNAPAAPTGNAELVEAVRDVMAERERQMAVEGWSPKHDDEHRNSEIAHAAACYALAGAQNDGPGTPAPFAWPWDAEWWKPKDRRQNLVRAAALAIAEIERLDRADAAHQDACLRHDCPSGDGLICPDCAQREGGAA